jgi:hypothetical protein
MIYCTEPALTEALYILYIQSINCAGLLDIQGASQNVVSADNCGIPRQTEGYSFSNHLISESVSVTPSSVIESSCYLLCSVSLWLV